VVEGFIHFYDGPFCPLSSLFDEFGIDPNWIHSSRADVTARE
jgi:hypothetical protein